MNCREEEKMSFPRTDFPIRFIHNRWAHKKILFEYHFHRQLELIYVVSGRLMVQCGINKTVLTGGDALIVNANEIHFALCLSDTAEYYVIVADAGLLGDDTERCSYIRPVFDGGILFNNRIEDAQARQCVLEIIEEMKSKAPGYEMIVRSLHLKMMGLLIRKRLCAAPSAGGYDAKKLEKLMCVLEYIKNNYEYDISLDTLSGLIHTGIPHFCRLFKQLVGETPVEYINKIRLNKACETLISSDKKVTEIALMCGFSNPAYFCRVFKRQFALTPLEYRRNLYSEERNEYHV